MLQLAFCPGVTVTFALPLPISSPPFAFAFISMVQLPGATLLNVCVVFSVGFFSTAAESSAPPDPDASIS